MPTNVHHVQPKSEKKSFFKCLISKFTSASHELNTPKNLTSITWAHAVNSQVELEEALNSTVDMIEADIVMGRLHGVGPELPIMGHPPANESDLSLQQFLEKISEYNKANPNATKGVKLDFKSIEVFEDSLYILDFMVEELTCPIWLNADIIAGPVNQTVTVPVDPQRFLDGCSRYLEHTVLSIGWTTRWGANYTEGEYTEKQIDEMLNEYFISTSGAYGQAVTYPVRAGIAANSFYEMGRLLNETNSTTPATLTIWSSANDYVDVEKLRYLILEYGVDRIYLDVPKSLSDQLDLGRDNDENETGTGKADGNLSPIKCKSLFFVTVAVLLLTGYWLRRI